MHANLRIGVGFIRHPQQPRLLTFCIILQQSREVQTKTYFTVLKTILTLLITYIIVRTHIDIK